MSKNSEIKDLLSDVGAGKISVDKALTELVKILFDGEPAGITIKEKTRAEEAEKEEVKKRGVGSGEGEAKTPSSSVAPESLTEAKLNVAKRKISALLKENTRGELEFGKRSGKLYKRKLPKVEVDDVKVFSKRRAKKAKTYEITLLVDQSGSMLDYDKRETATDCAIELARIFNRLDHVKVNIYGFSDDFLRVYNEGESLQKPGDIKKTRDRMITASHCNNCDGEFVDQACRRFSGEGERILLVLSDGEPAGCIINTIGARACKEGHKVCRREIDLLKEKCGASDDGDVRSRIGGDEIYKHEEDALRKVIKRWGNDGVKIGSVGIKTEAPKRYYKRNTIIHELNDLVPATLKLLNNLINK